jgi:PAS domain S-box-containing protein
MVPVPKDEEARLAALCGYNVLDTEPDPAFDSITSLAAAVCGTPIALISLIDSTRQWFKSSYGIDPEETPRALAFCAYTILEDEVMVVENATADPRFRENPFVTGEPYVRFYAGAPLITSSGARIGSLCVIDSTTRSITEEQKQLLRGLAVQAILQLELRRKVSELEHARQLMLENAAVREVAEARLAESEARYRVISEHAPVGIFEADAKGECLYVNPAWERITGLTHAAALGSGWRDAIHPDDVETVMEEWEQSVHGERIDGVPSAFTLEFRFLRPDGQIRHSISRATALHDEEGVVSGFVGTVEDVTDRKAAEIALRESEERMSLVIEGSSDGFWDWDIPTGAVQFSRRAVEMLGYEVGELEPHVRSWQARVHPDDVEEVSVALETHLAGLTASYQVEHRLQTKSAEWIWILDRGKVSSRDGKGNPLRMSGTHTDITLRKHAQEELQRFFDLSLDMLCILDLSGRFRRVNRAFEKLLGYGRGELVGRPLSSHVHPHDQNSLRDELGTLAAADATRHFKHRVESRDGTAHILSWVASSSIDDGLIYIAARDVTEKIRSAEALARSEERHRDILENATDLIQAVSPEGKFLYVNPSWRATLGYSLEELEQLTIFDVIHPENQEHCRLALRRLMEGEEVPKLEVAFVTRDGRRRVVEGNVSCRFENGVAVSTRGIFRDVTERKQTEQELIESHEALRAREAAVRSLIDSAISAVLTFSRGGIIESANPAALRVFGYAPDELIGQSVEILLPVRPVDFESYQREVMRRSLGRMTEMEVRHADGRILPVDVALFEFEAVSGKQIACYVRDVSDRREVERLKQEFVSTVSHELRTPLTSIRGSLDLLNGGVLGPLAPPAEEVVSIALRNTKRLISLINDILDLDRMERGYLELMMAPVTVQSLFLTASEIVREFAAENQVSIRFEESDSKILADGSRIVQVLVNLLSNAIKFSPPGSEVLMRVSSENRQVVITVEDRGQGIPAAFLPRVFERFQQADSSHARSWPGSGLGLSICRRIVEQHGGSISVVSKEGLGSRFSFVLTAATDRIPSEAPVVTLDRTLSRHAWLRRTLEEQGIRLITCADAEATLRMLQGGAAAVILDLDDPVADRIVAKIQATPALDGKKLIAVAENSPRGEDWLRHDSVVVAAAEPLAILAAARKVLRRNHEGYVLVVEDDVALSMVLQRQLAADGLRVRVASTGRAALDAVGEQRPDLIVLDVALPDVDGFGVVAALQTDAVARKTPLLVYSGRDLLEQDRARLLLGPTRFLTKSRASDQEFRKVVGQLLTRRRETR